MPAAHKKKLIGLKLLTMGFLVIPVGGGVAWLGVYVKTNFDLLIFNFFGASLQYLGLFVVAIGFVAAFAGVILHWFNMMQE